MKSFVFTVISLSFLVGCTTSSTPPATDLGQQKDIDNTQKDAVEAISDTTDISIRDISTNCTTDDDCKDIKTGSCQVVACQEGKCVSKNALSGKACTLPTPDGMDTDCISGVCDKNGKCIMSISSSGTPCNDNNLCTDKDVCSNGVCIGTSKVCPDDGNSCTKEECDTKTGNCISTELGTDTSCDDGNLCSKGDHCKDGKCIAGQNNCNCTLDSDCKKYNDSNKCNGILKCVQNVCVIDPNTVVTCNTSGDDQCHHTRCVPDTGNCKPSLLAGKDCDDKNKCTFNDKCLSNGNCEGSPVKCNDDGNPCTTTSCDTTTGNCVKQDVNDNTPCNLDDKCQINEKCVAGTCKGEKNPCDDGNPCTLDICDPDAANDGCKHKPNTGATCDDGNACTKATTCQADGTCGGGTSTCECAKDDDCTDTNLCDGKMICKEQSGGTKKCVNDPSTAIHCNTSGDDDCNKTICIPKTGKCISKPVADNFRCDDGDVCTINTKCSNGTCNGGILIPDCCYNDADCDDNNPCTKDSCTVSTGKCVNDNRVKNFDVCGQDKVCWYGNCLTQNIKNIPLPVSFAGKITNTSFTGIGAVGLRRFAIANQRVQDISCIFKNGVLDCTPQGTWTDKGFVYEINGITASKVNNSGLSGQTGNMVQDTNGSYIFPSDVDMTTPIEDISNFMAVGSKGQIGLLDLSNNSPEMNWGTDNPAAQALSGFLPDKLTSVWHGLETSGYDCISRADRYLVTGSRKSKGFISLCTKDKHCKSLLSSCTCDPAVWSCTLKPWNINTTVVDVATGYSAIKDYNTPFIINGTVVSVEGMTVAAKITTTDVNVGRIKDPSSTSTTTLGKASFKGKESLSDIVAVTDSTGLMITNNNWTWYNSNSKTPITDVTPQNDKEDCTFYKAFEYDQQVLIVGVCIPICKLGQTCFKTYNTYVYYADCSQGWPGKDEIKVLTAISDLGYARQGRAVSASDNNITVVGGDQDQSGVVAAFLK